MSVVRIDCTICVWTGQANLADVPDLRCPACDGDLINEMPMPRETHHPRCSDVQDEAPCDCGFTASGGTAK